MSMSTGSTFTSGERTAQDVHASLCALVVTEAAKNSAWADYAAMLLDEETADFFAARLPEAKAPSKKRQQARTQLTHKR